MATATVIEIKYSDEYGLGFDGDRLATVDEYNQCGRDVGSIFEALEPGEVVLLSDGDYVLDADLDPVAA